MSPLRVHLRVPGGRTVQQTQIAFDGHVLSNDISETFLNFVADVLNSALSFHNTDKTRSVLIAVITRRCYVMFFACYELLLECINQPTDKWPLPWQKYSIDTLKEFINIFRECVITDNAAWAMAYDIVRQYREKHSSKSSGIGEVFPLIITVDELLFHGRALNGFLYGFEKRLLNADSLLTQKSGTQLSIEDSIQNAFLRSLIIRVANRNVGSSVLLPRYQKNLIDNNPGTDLDIMTWRNYSIAYAQYVSVCGINNTGFTLGFVIPTQHERQVSSNDNSSFTRIQTRLQGIEQDTWLYFYPSVSQPTMICTVRRKQCHVSVEQNMYVPFLIVDHIIPDQLFQLHQLLLKDALTSGMVKVAHLLKRMDDVFLAEEVQKKSLLVSWFSQTTDLVLTSWLMKRFLHEVKGVGEDEVAGIWKDAIDWNQLCGNFRSFNAEKQTYNETLDALKELWSWDPVRPLEEYFDIYTYKAKALSVDWMNLIPPVTPIELGENSPLVQCIEDTISMIGLEAEQNAYTLYGSGLSFSDEALTNWGDNHSIDTLLSKIHAQSQIYSTTLDQVNIYDTLAVITQSMDLGLLGMNTILDKQPCSDRVRYESNPRELYTRQRAGEASLFILPIRYRNLLPVLNEIQNKRKNDFEGAAFDLSHFIDVLASEESTKTIRITNDILMTFDQLKRSIYSAYEMLVKGGQNIKEWQCALHDRRLPFAEQEQIGALNRAIKTHFLWMYRNM